MAESNDDSEAARNVLVQALQSLEQAGVRHGYWKASRRLPEALSSGSDYDLLVEEGKRQVWERVFKEHGFIEFRTRAENELPQMAHFVACDTDTGAFVHLHVHEEPLSGDYGVWEYVLSDSQALLRHRELDVELDVYRLSAALEVCLLLLRAFSEPKMRLRGGGLTERAERDLAYAWERTSVDDVARVGTGFFGGAAANALAAELQQVAWPMQTQDLARIHPIIQPVLSRFRRPGRLKFEAKRFTRRGLGYARVAYEKTRPRFAPSWSRQGGLRAAPHGLFIAVVGPDGSGKSTLVDYLSGWLGSMFDLEEVYLGRGDVVSATWQGLARLKWRVAGAIGVRPDVAIAERASQGQIASASAFDRQRTGLRRRVWELARIAQAGRQLRKVGRIAQQRSEGRLVLTDRFPHHEERFAGGPAILPDESSLLTQRSAELERTLLRKVCARRPDLLIRLSIDAVDAWQRKPEHNLEDIRRKVDALEQAQWHGTNQVVIDASMPLEEVQRQARRAVWSLFS